MHVVLRDYFLWLHTMGLIYGRPVTYMIWSDSELYGMKQGFL